MTGSEALAELDEMLAGRGLSERTLTNARTFLSEDTPAVRFTVYLDGVMKNGHPWGYLGFYYLDFLQSTIKKSESVAEVLKTLVDKVELAISEVPTQ